jgi:hypothetical protein
MVKNPALIGEVVDVEEEGRNKYLLSSICSKFPCLDNEITASSPE